MYKDTGRSNVKGQKIIHYHSINNRHDTAELHGAKPDKTAQRNKQIQNYNRNFNNDLSIINSTSRKEIKPTEDSKVSINQLDIIGIYKIFHLTIAKHTLFSRVHRAFTKIDYILSYQTNYNKF